MLADWNLASSLIRCGAHCCASMAIDKQSIKAMKDIANTDSMKLIMGA